MKGVAVVRSDGPGETCFDSWRPYQCPIPHVLKDQVMRSKAGAFCDGYYVKAMESPDTRKIWRDWMEEDEHIIRSYCERAYDIAVTPSYAELRARIVDGDGFDDQEMSGDYLRACRIALEMGR